MTLGKLLEGRITAGNGNMIHLSTGSSFIIVAPADEIVEELDRLDKELLTLNKRRLQGIKRGIRERKEKIEGNLNVVEVAKLKRTIEKQTRVMKEVQNYLKNIKPLSEREVIDTYPRIQMDGIVVKVEGIETGSYWYRDEYLRDNRQGRNQTNIDATNDPYIQRVLYKYDCRKREQANERAKERNRK